MLVVAVVLMVVQQEAAPLDSLGFSASIRAVISVFARIVTSSNYRLRCALHASYWSLSSS